MTMIEGVLGLTVDGNWRWKEHSLNDVLGKDPRSTSLGDLSRLSWKAVLRLFHAAPAPRLEDLEGEYRAVILPVGVFAPLAAFFTHTFFGPGRWQGKGFKPRGQNHGEGYNLFGNEPLHRTRRFNTSIGPSRFDGKPSFCLDYSPYNRFLVHSMKDEIRQLSSELFIGLGTMSSGGGALNPAPFAVFGQPQPWRGPREE
jgi:hypothetical protein